MDQQQLIDQHLSEADRARERGDADEAAVHHLAVLNLWDAGRPVPAGILYEVGEYYRELGFLELALGHLRRSHELAPGRWRTFLALGRTYFDQGNFRDAQGHFQESQRLVHDQPEPGFPSQEFASASAYEHIADIVGRHRPPDQFATLESFYSEAARLYQKAGDAAAAARCRLRVSLGPLDEATVLSQTQPFLELGYRLFPKNAELACRLGTIYASQGRDRQACRCYLRASALDSPWRGRAREAAAAALNRLQILPEEVRRLSENT